MFPDLAEARHVINDLRAFGLRLDQLSVAMRDLVQQDRLMAVTGLRASDGAVSRGAKVNPQGGLRGMLAGLRAGLLPNKPSLDGAISSQVPALPSGMLGALMSMRMSEAGARRQEASYRAGSVLLTVSLFENVAEARGIMQRHGGGIVEWEKPATN